MSSAPPQPLATAAGRHRARRRLLSTAWLCRVLRACRAWRCQRARRRKVHRTHQHPLSARGDATRGRFRAPLLPRRVRLQCVRDVCVAACAASRPRRAPARPAEAGRRSLPLAVRLAAPMPGQALAGSTARAAVAASSGRVAARRQAAVKPTSLAKRVDEKSAWLGAGAAPPAALRRGGRRADRRRAPARRCCAEHDAGAAFPEAAESHASSAPAAGAPCCGAGCADEASADSAGVHSHSHTHSHSHGGDEAPLQAGLSHGHSHGGGEALRHGGNAVQRALAAFFRLCGLMQLANLLRNSLPVISAAWVCMVRRCVAFSRAWLPRSPRGLSPQTGGGGLRRRGVPLRSGASRLRSSRRLGRDLRRLSLGRPARGAPLPRARAMLTRD